MEIVDRLGRRKRTTWFSENKILVLLCIVMIAILAYSVVRTRSDALQHFFDAEVACALSADGGADAVGRGEHLQEGGVRFGDVGFGDVGVGAARRGAASPLWLPRSAHSAVLVLP